MFVKSDPFSIAEGLNELLRTGPLTTLADLASRTNKPMQWISNRLNLLRIKDEFLRGAISDGHICVKNAIELSKIPESEQMSLHTKAVTESPVVFWLTVKHYLVGSKTPIEEYMAL